MVTPQLDRAWEKTDSSIILKTRIIGFHITFRLRQSFATLEVEILYGEIFL